MKNIGGLAEHGIIVQLNGDGIHPVQPRLEILPENHRFRPFHIHLQERDAVKPGAVKQ